MGHVGYRIGLPMAFACLAVAAFAPSAAGAAMQPGGATGSQPASKTKAAVACKRPSRKRMRCTMTIKGGAGISGSVAMRITTGKLVVARGHGRLTRGKATLTMRIVRRIKPGRRYTVSMVVTRATIRAKMVLRLT